MDRLNTQLEIDSKGLAAGLATERERHGEIKGDHYRIRPLGVGRDRGGSRGITRSILDNLGPKERAE